MTELVMYNNCFLGEKKKKMSAMITLGLQIP